VETARKPFRFLSLGSHLSIYAPPWYYTDAEEGAHEFDIRPYEDMRIVIAHAMTMIALTMMGLCAP
jgi:hypothetical protein